MADQELTPEQILAMQQQAAAMSASGEGSFDQLMRDILASYIGTQIQGKHIMLQHGANFVYNSGLYSQKILGIDSNNQGSTGLQNTDPHDRLGISPFPPRVSINAGQEGRSSAPPPAPSPEPEPKKSKLGMIGKGLAGAAIAAGLVGTGAAINRYMSPSSPTTIIEADDNSLGFELE